MAYNWFDLNRTDVWEFYMVSPQSMDQIYGKLDGVLLNSVRITGAYYTDSRASGSLSFVDNGQYIPYSFIRIIYRVPEWNYSREIGTFMVRTNPSNYKNGQWTVKCDLGSKLDQVYLRHGAAPWTVASGAYVIDVITQMMKDCSFEWTNLSANNYRVEETFVYETGGTFLERLFDLCSLSNNRLDVNGHGVLTVAPYIEPRQRAASFRLDLSDPKGLVLDGLSFESDVYSVPNRCIVSYRFNVQENDEVYEAEVRAIADSTGNNAIGKIGYVISDFYQISESEAEDMTYEGLQTIANLRLAMRQPELIEWNITCKFLPLWEGDIVELVIHDGPKGYTGARHCLVKNVVIHPASMTMDLALVETNGGENKNDY